MITVEELKVKTIAHSLTLERCWAIRNYVGTTLGRYDKADEIGAMICDLLLQYVPVGKMKDLYDDNCTEYWEKVGQHFRDGR